MNNGKHRFAEILGKRESGSIERSEADRDYRYRGDPRRSSAGVRGSGAMKGGDEDPVERRATVEKTTTGEAGRACLIRVSTESRAVGVWRRGMDRPERRRRCSGFRNHQGRLGGWGSGGRTPPRTPRPHRAGGFVLPCRRRRFFPVDLVSLSGLRTEAWCSRVRSAVPDPITKIRNNNNETERTDRKLHPMAPSVA